MYPHPSGLLLSQKIHLMGMLQIYNFILKVQKETDKILCNSLQCTIVLCETISYWFSSPKL